MCTKKVLSDQKLGPETGTVTAPPGNPTRRRPRRNIRVRITTNDSSSTLKLVAFMAIVNDEESNSLNLDQSLAWQVHGLKTPQDFTLTEKMDCSCKTSNGSFGAATTDMTVDSIYFVKTEGQPNFPENPPRPAPNSDQIYITNYRKKDGDFVLENLNIMLVNGMPYSALLRTEGILSQEHGTFTLNGALYFGLTSKNIPETQNNPFDNYTCVKKEDYENLSPEQSNKYDGKFFQVNFGDATETQPKKQMIIHINVINNEGQHTISSEITYE